MHTCIQSNPSHLSTFISPHTRSLPQVQQLTASLQSGEGCNIAGYLEVERVAGNFHVSTHSHSFHVLEAVLHNNHGSLNVSHTVHSLSFGPPFPGVVNPLDDNVRMLSKVCTRPQPARAPLTLRLTLKCHQLPQRLTSYDIESGPWWAHTGGGNALAFKPPPNATRRCHSS